mgnify:CR=1 FL=1
MKIVILQTSDGVSEYTKMHNFTKDINTKYCDLYGYNYVEHVGVIRGPAPWFATYNRLFLLPDMIGGNEYDWIVYLDADAVMSDFTRSLEEFIGSDTDKVIISSGDGVCPQAGVMIINANHDKSFKLFSDARDAFLQIPENELDNYIEPWCAGIPNDQRLIHNAAKKILTPDDVLLYNGKSKRVINAGYVHGVSFISQALTQRRKSKNDKHCNIGPGFNTVQGRIAAINKWSEQFLPK